MRGLTRLRTGLVSVEYAPELQKVSLADGLRQTVDWLKTL
jgi:hypothetical protein